VEDVREFECDIPPPAIRMRLAEPRDETPHEVMQRLPPGIIWLVLSSRVGRLPVATGSSPPSLAILIEEAKRVRVFARAVGEISTPAALTFLV
jgi:hypothetical protein